MQSGKDDKRDFRRLNTHAGLLAVAIVGGILFSYFQRQNSAVPDLSNSQAAVAGVTSSISQEEFGPFLSPEQQYIDDLLDKHGMNINLTNPYGLTTQDLDFAIRIVATEGSPDEPDEGLKGIIDVILNRMKSSYFPHATTIKNTIASEGQFDA